MTTTTILQAADRAARSIPPLWPLASSVAVNPFLGQTGEPLATASARLRRTAGIALTMPRSWYAARLRSGEIADEDLQAALDAAPVALRPNTLAALRQAADTERPTPQPILTVAELARDLSGIDWPRLVEERISHFAAGYFDQGQALWIGGPPRGAWAAWRAVAMHDLTPEIVGLKGFAQSVADAPADAEAALAESVSKLGLTDAALESCFHRLLTTLGGWAQVARYRLWQAELAGRSDGAVTDLLAIRIAWEAALLRQYGAALEPQWQATMAAHAEPATATADDTVDTILQEASERAAQRRLHALLAAKPTANTAHDRPALQMAFCIDVRSEVFRRALESVGPGIRTLGFAGFFGLRLGHRRFASDVVEDRLPVLLTPTLLTCSGTATPVTESADLAARIAARAKRAWGRFRLAAISSFAFVEAAGPLYVGKLLSDGLALKRHPAPNDPAPRLAEGLDSTPRNSRWRRAC
jgi:uncharacterized protein YbcC (UPF0753/DUF2309 family)